MKLFKNNRVVLILLCILIMVACLSRPITVFALEVPLKNIKDYVKIRVEKNDQLVNSIHQQVEGKINSAFKYNELLYKAGLYGLEQKTGLDQNNSFYAKFYNNQMNKLGRKEGIVIELKEMALFFPSLALKYNPDMLKNRIINTAFMIAEDPGTYINKVNTGLNLVSYILKNPAVTARAFYQGTNELIKEQKKYLAEVEKDPLQMGRLEGRAAFWVGSFASGGAWLSPSKVGIVNEAGIANKFSKIVSKTELTRLYVNDKAIFLPKQANQIQHLPALNYRYQVGDMFEGLKVTAVNGNSMELENGITLFSNVRIGQEDVSLLRSFHNYYLPKKNKDGFYIDSQNQLIQKLLYVIKMDENILLSTNKIGGKRVTHSMLAHGEPVRASGEILIKYQKIKTNLSFNAKRVLTARYEWNDNTGHYLCNGVNYENFVGSLAKKIPEIKKDNFKAFICKKRQ